MNHSYSGLGFISGKLLMNKDKGHIFVKYTIVAMVHMICTMETSYKYYMCRLYLK